MRPVAGLGPSTASSPSTSQPRPRRSLGAEPGRKRSSPRRSRRRPRAPDRRRRAPPVAGVRRSPVGSSAATRSIPSRLASSGGRARARGGGRAGAVGQHVDARRARARADRELGVLGVARVRLQHAPVLAERRPQRRASRSTALWAWSAIRITRVVGEEGVDAAGRVDELAEAAVGVGDRLDAALGPVAVRVVVVVGEREEQEVVEVAARPARGRRRPSTRRASRGAPGSACRGRGGSRRARRRRARPGPRRRGGSWRRRATRRSRPSRPSSWRWRPR